MSLELVINRRSSFIPNQAALFSLLLILPFPAAFPFLRLKDRFEGACIALLSPMVHGQLLSLLLVHKAIGVQLDEAIVCRPIAIVIIILILRRPSDIISLHCFRYSAFSTQFRLEIRRARQDQFL